jgi:hypothetical protein
MHHRFFRRDVAAEDQIRVMRFDYKYFPQACATAMTATPLI